MAFIRDNDFPTMKSIGAEKPGNKGGKSDGVAVCEEFAKKTPEIDISKVKVEPLFEDAFTLYEKLGQFYEKKGYSEISHSRMRRYEILLEFVKEELEEKSVGKSGNQDPEVENPAGKTAEDCRGMETATWEKVADSMIYDLYLRENLKSHPSFEYDQKPYEKAVWEYRRQEKVPKTAHIEVFRDGKTVLFDYENRDPLLHNAAVKEIQI